MSEVGYWRLVTQWCLGENDTFGTCAFAAIGNLHCVVTTANGVPEVMSDGEIEAMDHSVTGFDPTDPATDKGAQLKAVLDYWMNNGWTGDPTMKPLWYGDIPKRDIPAMIKEYGGVYAWCLLPMRDDEPDLSDGALQANTPGTAAHAVLIVGAADGVFWIATWGEVREISVAWWDRYGREQYAVLHPAWKRPVTT